MEVRFLGHGLNIHEDSVGKMLLESFSDPDFNKFTCLVAFASPSGVGGLSDKITESKSHISTFEVFVGIAQKSTSKEALEALLQLDINTRVYYTVSHIIFHPKIYIFEGVQKCRIIIGSSNLTKQGLFSNVEASLVVNYGKPDTEGEEVLNQICGYFSSFLGGSATNVQKLSQELIDKLATSKVIPSETERARVQDSKPKRPETEEGGRAFDRVKSLFPTINVQQPSASFRRQHGAARPAIQPAQPIPSSGATPQKGNLVWKKTRLSGSDIEQPPKANSNPKGSISLTKSGFKVNGRVIDQTKYFREQIFGGFQWQIIRTSPMVESTKVLFNVNILGNDEGQFTLELRHKPSGEAGQGNYTTAISWGATLASKLRRANLIGKELLLYAPAQGQEPFFIEIR